MDVSRFLLGTTESSSTPLPFLLALLIMTPILVISTRRRMRRSNRPAKQPERTRTSNILERADAIRRKRSTEAASGAAMLEFQEYARTIQAQIDNRYQKLEKAAAHADQKIAELRALLAQSGSNADGDPPGVDPNMDVWHTIANARTQD